MNIEEVTVNVLTGPCIGCAKTGVIVMPLRAFLQWYYNHVYIQIAWPNSSVADREQLISGTHGPCFDKMFQNE